MLAIEQLELTAEALRFDVAPRSKLLQPPSSYPAATGGVNPHGSTLVLSPGIGLRKLQVIDYTLAGGSTVTLSFADATAGV